VTTDPQPDWGLLGSFDLIRAHRIPPDLVRSWQVAQHSVGLVVQPIEQFELAGTLNSHPGRFQHAPWDPVRGRVLLRLARAAFPEVRPRTDNIVAARYDPRIKLLAAIHGEPQRRAEWP
jgi:hypothetical protein